MTKLDKTLRTLFLATGFTACMAATALFTTGATEERIGNQLKQSESKEVRDFAEDVAWEARDLKLAGRFFGFGGLASLIAGAAMRGRKERDY